jgi:hypothetical protein
VSDSVASVSVVSDSVLEVVTSSSSGEYILQYDWFKKQLESWKLEASCGYYQFSTFKLSLKGLIEES